MNLLKPVSPLLLGSLLLVGCQKDVREVRRTKPAIDGGGNGYSVDTGQYAVSGAKYSVDTGNRYSVDGSRPHAAATPTGSAVGLPGSPRTIGH
jgi:hypothetical protein